MKKLISILLCMAVFLSFIGCQNQKNASKKSKGALSENDDSSSSTIVTTPVTPSTSSLINESSTPDSSIKEEADKIANEFLNALKSKNIDVLRKYIKASDEKVFDVIKNIEFKNTQLTPIESPNNVCYKVSFETNCTDPNLFKSGKNELILTIAQNPSLTVNNFSGEDLFDKGIVSNADYNKSKICWQYEFLTTEYPQLSVAKTKLSPDDYQLYYDDILSRSIGFYYMSTGRETKLTPEEINQYITSKFGFKDYDVRNSRFYDKSTGYMNYDWVGSSEFYKLNTISITPINNSQVEIIVDYFADNIRFVKSKTVKYIVSGEPDKNCTIVSRTVIYDNKLPNIIC